MTKVRLTDELIRKAKQVFDMNPTILAGQGLTRGELRRLVNAKRLKKRLVLVGQQYRCYYMRPGTYQALKDKKRIKRKLTMKPTEEKKLGLFARIWLSIKKFFKR